MGGRRAGLGLPRPDLGAAGPLGAQAPHRGRHRGGAAPDGGGRAGRQHGPARPVAGADRSRASGRRVGQARAQAINNFLVNDLLGQADPERNPAGADLTVRQLLDRAARSLAVAESVALEPGVEGAVRSTIGNVYLELGLYPEADEQLSQGRGSLVAGRRPPGGYHLRQNRAIWADAMRGSRSAGGRTGCSRRARTARPRAPRDRIRRGYLGALNRGNPRAMPLLRENLEIQRRRFGTDHQLALRGPANW